MVFYTGRDAALNTPSILLRLDHESFWDTVFRDTQEGVFSKPLNCISLEANCSSEIFQSNLRKSFADNTVFLLRLPVLFVCLDYIGLWVCSMDSDTLTVRELT